MVHGRPRLLGIEVLQVVERARDPAWGFLKDPRTLQYSCAILSNGSISRKGSDERSGGRNRKDRAGEAGGRPAPRPGSPEGQGPRCLEESRRSTASGLSAFYPNLREGEETVSPGCQSGFAEQPQSLFSYHTQTAAKLCISPE